MSLSIEQLLSALARKGIPLPFEMGAFVLLEATEQVLVLEATSDAPSLPLVAAAEVELSDEGEVSIGATPPAATEQDACHALVSLLGDLLVRSAPGVPPMLLELVEQGPSDGQWTLLRLRDDLEATLVPLNRGAMRRVLARLLREVRRDTGRTAAASVSTPDSDALDDELDAVLGTPSPSRRLRPREDITAEVDLDELRPDRSADPPARAPERTPATRPARKARPRATPPRAALAAPRVPRELTAEAARPGHGGVAMLDELEHAMSRGGAGVGARLGLGLALLAGVLIAAYVMLGRDGARSLLGLRGPAPTSSAAAPKPEHKPMPRVGELRVQSTPERAQVLMLIGAGPAVAPKLPLGVAYEFVAVAPGHAPSRAVVPADAQWQHEGGEPRYELALQLGDASPHHGEWELGPTRLPQEMGSPEAQLGSVRVITSPPGAKVYQLIGFTPDVRVENQPIDAPVELLVYLDGYGVAKLSASAADYKPEGDHLVASLSATLTKHK